MRTADIKSGRSKNNYLAKRRIRLMEKHPFCHWCNRPLKLYPDYPEKYQNKPMPEDYPTIDHLNSKTGLKKRPDPKMKARTLVLSCPSCNNNRAKKEMQTNIWVTRWKSCAFPYYLKWFEKLLRWYRKNSRN